MDDDGMMLNFSPARPRAISKPTKSIQQSTKTSQTKNPALPARSSESRSSSAATPSVASTPTATAPSTDEATSTTTTKYLHGKAQIQSSLFTSNPAIKPETSLDSTRNKSDQLLPSNAPGAADDTTNSFASLGLGMELIQALEKMNVHQPTLVQRRALPLLLGPAQHQQMAYDTSNKIKSKNSSKSDVDVVVQAQTGSGKTLTYLLPIVQRLVAASTYDTEKSSSKAAFGDRTIGTVAIILTPTRELAQQVTSVLQQLLQLPRPAADSNYRRLHWMVAGMVMGGDNKAKEKARLRKGVTLLVSTPGRLLDHLQNTKSFDIRHLKWLVLDEADRLLDLGFEETLKNIMELIKERTNQPPNTAFRQHLQSPVWPCARQTILCSATLRDDVKHLAGTALVDPVFVRGSSSQDDDDGVTSSTGLANKKKTSVDDQSMDLDNDNDGDYNDDSKFSTPNQLNQTYTITPAKLRLVTLTAMLQQCMKDKRKASKVIVFFSCCDSVDFHYDLFANGGKPLKSDVDEDKDDLMAILDNHDDDNDDGDDDDKDDGFTKYKKRQQQKNKKTKKERQEEQEAFRRQPSQLSALLGGGLGTNGGSDSGVPVYRLHGDLEQQIRTLTFTSFSEASSGVLLCTDVAARGLDLPNVDRIIQYDPPTDLKDYVHRVGRTARLGKAGEARLFLLPSEMDYLPILKSQGMNIQAITVESVLASAFGKIQHVYESKAQEYQNQLEKYVLSEEEHVMLARKAFWSSVRAYATHAASEKHVFHVKKLHLGHLAKSFALREAPSHLQDPNKLKKKKDAKQDRMPGKQKLLDKDNGNKSKSGHGKQGGNNKAGGGGGIQQKKRKQYDQADEFAIATSDYMAGGPTTKKKKKAGKAGK